MSGVDLVPYLFDEHPVRTVMREGEPWFVASDVCAILQLGNSRDAISRHVDKEDRDGVGIPDSTGRIQRQTIVNISGVFALSLGSTLPEAKRFKRWVTVFKADARGAS